MKFTRNVVHDVHFKSHKIWFNYLNLLARNLIFSNNKTANFVQIRQCSQDTDTANR